MNNDISYMQQCIELAKNGRLTCSPNPMVGCIIVKNNQIISQAFHAKVGDHHAEVLALQMAGKQANGATLYVNLEPCCHHGKTPPCVDAIIQAGIKRVVIAMQDPNPLVRGQGKSKLESHNIDATEHILEEKAKSLNRIFCHYIQHKSPYVIAKWAMSLDGKTITHPGDSRSISGEEANQETHLLRQQVDAILIGRQTAINDDPQLTARPFGKLCDRQPLRIILTRKGDLPEHLKIFNISMPSKTIVVTREAPDKTQYDFYQANNIEVIQLNKSTNKTTYLKSLLNILGERGVSSILVEGGQTTHNAFFEAGLVNEVKTIISPVIIANIEKKLKLQTTLLQQFNQDLILTTLIGEQ